jgi:ABC-type dipeptide/oligopeptide/nickel transport system permease subunit
VRDRTGDAVLLPLGASDVLGRDELLRLLYGGRSSLIVAALAAGITASIVALARRRVLRAVAVGSMVAAGAVVFDVLVWGGFGVGSSSTWGGMLLTGADYWTSRPLLLIAPLVAAAVPVTGFVLSGVGLAAAGRRAHPRGSLT